MSTWRMLLLPNTGFESFKQNRELFEQPQRLLFRP